ncbi:DUF2794 domain-containing protein [Parvibaculum sp.]|jgi:hypothetical protein|uniref:DUF2794 domain-containing protein n=1 Tax=Parvibaculum sp. TaxID=2024848 RepID=UPI0032669F98
MTDSADYGSRKGEAAERLTLVTGGPRPETAPKRQRDPEVFFDRSELDAILSVYGRKVAEGEWRDYAMGGFRDVAIFSVFRRASEMPLYRIEKRPKLARRQGAYSVIAATGLVLKRGHELKQVLKVFEKRSLRLIDA